MLHDVLFKACRIIDGTGAVPFLGSVAVKDGLVSVVSDSVNNVLLARRTIDCNGAYLAPGFIDIHAHSDLQTVRERSMKAKVMQGIVTEVCGNCGMGVFPCPPGLLAAKRLVSLMQDVLGPFVKEAPWQDLTSYRTFVSSAAHGTNLIMLQAHAPLRLTVMADDPNRLANSSEISAMAGLLEVAFSQGAAGFSTGLYYSPCMHATDEELLALLRVTAKHDRLFAVHHRCEGDDVLDSLRHVLSLAKQSGVRLEIAHLKPIGKANQAKTEAMLSLIDQALADGIDVGFNQYPYEYGSTSLFSLLPPAYVGLNRGELRLRLSKPQVRQAIRHEMEHPVGWDSLVSLCGWQDITIAAMDHAPGCNGMGMLELAAQRGVDPWELFFDLVATETGRAVLIDVTQSQQTLTTIMRHRAGGFATDALYGPGLVHPRSHHAVHHLLDRYCKQEPVLPLEEHVKRSTLRNAQRLGLHDRGRIAVGLAADLVVLDMERMQDVSTVALPDANCRGIEWVMVNGVFAVEHGVPTGSLSGKML